MEKISEETAKGKPIIVEGKKDIDALKELAIKGKIITAKTGKSLLDVVSEIERTCSKEVVALLDFDRRGRELTKSLKQFLERAGVKFDITMWSELSLLVGGEVKDVEGLATYMKTLKSKIYIS